jgi:hypothetical protein
VCLGVALLAGSAGFRLFAVPALVRFPLDIDETTHYAGTSTTYLDQATLLPLTVPKVEPLSLSRHVKVMSGDFGHAVIGESVSITAGSTTSSEKYQYVMDRRSMQLLNDPRTFAFGTATATMHPGGSYRINFARGTSTHGKYRSYIPEADASTPLVPVEGLHHHSDARIKVMDFAGKLEQPVAPYYRAHLKAMGLPMQVTVAQLQPQLAAAGIDVNKTLADVLPLLTPDESELLAATLAKPIPLEYFFIADGLVSIEPKTGALVDVHAQREGVAVRPDLSGASALEPLLDKYAAIPSVKALSDGLAAIAARVPQVAEELRYQQTVPSSLTAADKARGLGRRVTLATWWVPGVMAGLGLFLVVLGGIGWRRARRRGPDSPEIDIREPAPGGPDAPAPAPDPDHQHA